MIAGTGDGYRFDATDESVDVYRFEDLVGAGLDRLSDNPSRASSLLGDALDLWRGDPYGDVDGRGVFHTETARLSELRFAALEARIEADLACGRHRQLVAELEALVADHPLRERLWGALMLAMYRTGRQADALGAYQQLRAILGEQLGLDPSTELHELEEQILLHDPALDLFVPVPHNLPALLTSFVGRKLELIELGERLAETRLVTLTGTGGSGKTRLAIEYGRQVLDDYHDGVWFVDLRGVDADGVAPLIATTLGVITAGNAPISDQLVDALLFRRLLLILDNCEHVLGFAARFVERLVGRDGQARVLATSRESLGVPGEPLMSVRPMPVPERIDLQALVASDAATLFVERARSAAPSFVVDEHVVSTCEICRTVEGLPLALELAAAQLRVFSPEELARRLDDQLTTLRTIQRAGDTRHATIEATIEWSWDLLDDAERTLAGRLSVFRGTWSLVSAQAICGFAPIAADRTPEVVESLVLKSLIVADVVSGGSTRYRLLEPIRQYAASELSDHSTRQLRDRMIDHWSATLAGPHEPGSRFAWRDHERARELEADQANMTVAVEWALDFGRFEDAMTIFGSPFGDLLMLQHSSAAAASDWMATAVENRAMISSGVLLTALEVAGSIAALAALHEQRLEYAQLAIDLARTSEERRWFELEVASATNRLAGGAKAARMFDSVIAGADSPSLRASALLARTQYAPPAETLALLAEVMELSPLDSLGFYDECSAMIMVANCAGDAGRYDLAIRTTERALDLSRRSGSVGDACQAAVDLAWLYAAQGRLDEAAAVISDAVLAARRIIGPSKSTSFVPWRAASIARQQGDFDEARTYAAEALEAVEEADIGSQGSTMAIFTTRELALIARDEGHFDESHALLDDALRRLEDIDHADIVPWALAAIRSVRASVYLRTNDPDLALQHLTAVLAEPHRMMHLESLVAVDLTAIALAQQGRAEPAAHLKGAVDRERETLDLVVRPPDKPLRATAMLLAQTQLGHEWNAAVMQGREMTLEAAIEFAAAEAIKGIGPAGVAQGATGGAAP